MKPTFIFETAKDSDSRLTRLEPDARRIGAVKNPSCKVTLDPQKTGQTFLGFGGALTESSGNVLSFLKPEERTRVIEAFFSQDKGHAYTLARTHVNSCDFSLENWACVPERDESLESFSMERPLKWQIPLIQEAREAAGGDLKLMITPWSPPGWMKDNGIMNHGGKLLPGYYGLWARYLRRFIDELKKLGIPVWTMSVQNEPEAVQTWDSCCWTGTEEATFIAEHLGPELKRAGYDIPILLWDHNRDRLKERVEESMKVAGVERYVGGAAFHWYSGDQYENVAWTSWRFPKGIVAFTEGCIEGGPRPGAWFTGERYAHNIINDLNAGCTAWIDWNIALDTEGGPNHAGNFCDAPVLVNKEKGSFEFQSSYWYLGHFSRFIKPGAVRVSAKLESWMIPAAPDGRMGNMMEATAFANPDGTVILVLCNRTEADMIYLLADDDEGTQTAYRCPPRGIHTVVLSR